MTDHNSQVFQVDPNEFKSSVDRRFGLLIVLIVGTYAMLSALVGGGFLLRSLRSDLSGVKEQITKLNTDIAALRQDMAAVQSGVAELDRNMRSTKSAQ